MELCVRFDNEEFKDEDILRRKQACCHLIDPDDVEVNCNAHCDAQSDQDRLDKSRLLLQNHIGYPRSNDEELELSRWIPAPVEAALVGDDVVGNEVDSHGEDGPPVVTATLEALLIGKPARSIAKVRTNLPSHQEHEVVNGGQSYIAEEQHSQVPHDAHTTIMVVTFLHEISDFQCHQHT